MKALKYFALMMIGLCLITACSDDNGDGGEGDGVDTVLFHEFTGYIYVSSQYFGKTYYGNDAKFSVWTAGDQYIVKFSDPVWGDAQFGYVQFGENLQGTGNIKFNYMNYNGTYPAILKGTTLAPVIEIPSVMKGCTIYFHAGEASMADVVAGTYSGTNTVVVGGAYTYTANMAYTIKANPDSTITIEVPEYKLNNTIMGNLTLGAYTISNIAYDKKTETFHHVYGEDGLAQHFKAVNVDENGKEINPPTMDQLYSFAPNSQIILEPVPGGGIKVENSFQLGKMPFPIVATFEKKVMK